MNQTQLRITEIFYSLQGESLSVGAPTVFIRLTGCPLRCGYCDTAYAFKGGELMSLSEICQQVSRYNTQHITVTGGEPLAQAACLELLNMLCDQSYQVSLETSGAIDVASVDTRVVKVVDVKTPGSGESARNIYKNFDYLEQKDQLKFVICDRQDYEWSKDLLKTHQLTEACTVLFSPSHEQLSANELAKWILDDQLAIRMQIQLHKYLWGNEPGR